MPWIIPSESMNMASVTSVTATPASIPSGGSSTITATVVNPTQNWTGTVFDDSGGSATVAVSIAAENLTYSVDPTKKGLKGFIVLVPSSTTAGTVVVGADGHSWVFTAA